MKRLTCLRPQCGASYRLRPSQLNPPAYCDCGAPLGDEALQIQLLQSGRVAHTWHFNADEEIIVGRYSSSLLFRKLSIDLKPYLKSKTEISRQHVSLLQEKDQRLRVKVISDKGSVVIGRQTLTQHNAAEYLQVPFEMKITPELRLKVG